MSHINYYVSNIVLASEAGADTRHKLLETGSFTTSDILFDTGKASLQASSFPILDEIGEVMKTNPSKQLTIIGHTDSDGSDAANQKLSEQRAESVKTYLMYKHNIDSKQMTTLGKGESQPVASGNSAADKAKNRRVEFLLN
ncbi:OmpA family protein [Sinomicrobium sp.]